MNSAFYDPLAFCLTDYEAFEGDRQAAVMFSLELTMLWQSSRHDLPSPYWAVWSDDSEGYFGVFLLDQSNAPDPGILDLVKSLVDQARLRSS
ncbi:MAG TPA: hypothetical protein VN303_04490 [Pseudomonas sp.]|nr:hypothetical protein [Pseudomonas sp.]